jgi:anti-sigma factor RsiW
LASFIWQGATGQAEAQDLEEAAVRHSRNLPMDVVAGDLVKVEQYFDGKLPFAVHIPDVVRNQPVSVQLGGRVIDLSNQEAAYVRYDLPGGRMSVFVYPDLHMVHSEVIPGYVMGDRHVRIRQVRGYTTAQWHSQGLVYSLVTDLPEHELANVLTASMR